MNCNICDSEIEEDEGISGYFGICPVSFCCWCTSSITDMVIQLNGFDDIDTLQDRINDLKEDENYYLGRGRWDSDKIKKEKLKDRALCLKHTKE